jgi:hypothetical protein
MVNFNVPGIAGYVKEYLYVLFVTYWAHTLCNFESVCPIMTISLKAAHIEPEKLNAIRN